MRCSNRRHCLFCSEELLSGRVASQKGAHSRTKTVLEQKSELNVGDNLLLCNCCIVVPKLFHKATFDKIHLGHLEIQKCRLRANAIVWWPGMSKQISEAVKPAQNVLKIQLHQPNHSYHLHYHNTHGRKLPQICSTSRVKPTCSVLIIFPNIQK